MGARRQYATKPKDIFKKSYGELLKSAKRKHSNEFYIFKTIVNEEAWYSECSVDVYKCSLEHWKKVDGRWKKAGDQ